MTRSADPVREISAKRVRKSFVLPEPARRLALRRVRRSFAASLESSRAEVDMGIIPVVFVAMILDYGKLDGLGCCNR